MSAVSRARVRLGLRVAQFLLAGSTAILAASVASQGTAGALWVAESNGLLNISAGTGQVEFEIPHALGISALGVNDVDGSLWAYGKKSLHQYDRSGQLVLQVDTPLNTHGGDPVDVVVDGLSGNLWVGIKRVIYHYDLGGNLSETLGTTDDIRSVALDRSQSVLWVGMSQQILMYSQDGAIVGSVLPPGGSALVDLAYDRSIDEFWVSLSDRLRRYDRSGTVTFESYGTYSGSIAPDGSGGLWVAQGRVLNHFDAEGMLTLSLEPFAPDVDKAIADIVADPQDASVWVASARRIRRYAIDGDLLNEVPAQTTDGVIRRLFRASLYSDLDPPEIKILAPVGGALLNTSLPSLKVEYFDLGVGVDTASLAFKANGLVIDVTCTSTPTSAECLPIQPLPEGQIGVAATIADNAGNVSEPAQVTFAVDTVAPTISILEPSQDAITNALSALIRGRVSEPAAVTVNGISVPVDADLAFSYTTQLQEGLNTFGIGAVDLAGNQSSTVLRVTLDTVPPAIPISSLISISEPVDGQVTVTGQAGSAEPGSRVAITNVRTGQTFFAFVGADGSFTVGIAAEAGDELLIRVVDAAVNQSGSIEFTVANGLPPDPAVVATPLRATAVTPFSESTAFLYSGANPIQTGVTPGTITALRAAVLRGRVVARDGSALSHVLINVKDHPELGQTYSRLDGFFDLAVNGGGSVVLNYAKSGFMPVQRQIDAQWRDYSMIDDVVMTEWDAQVTSIDLASTDPIQIARGSEVTDASGTRRATLFFTQGTTAQLMMPDGTTQGLSSLHVRATEYTVGASGPRAMPGMLPATSGYTYAAELSADEAVASGAKSIQFSKPVLLYVDNFLNFPTGMIVPAGWYDREKAAWIPSSNGRVIKILGVQDGKALLSVTSTGQEASAADLTQLGITDEERISLAQTYSINQSLWRVPITHFTPWDCNWPYGPPTGAAPPVPSPPKGDDKEDKPECEEGSIIECQNQVLGESIPLVGTDLTLNYRSDRVEGRKNAVGLEIPITGASVPAPLKRVDLQVEVAGKKQVFEFPAQPNQVYRFTWDGTDAYGRQVLGGQRIAVRVSNVYNAVYYTPAQFGNAFSQVGGVIVGIPARQEISLATDYDLNIGSPNARAVGLGGWTLSVHHSYDPAARVLYRGDGSTVRADNVSTVVSTMAGNGQEVSAGNGVPALQAGIGAPRDLAKAADGSIYVADGSRIRRIAPNGVITDFAGGASQGSSGDNGPALQARFNNPKVAIAPDGTLFIIDSANHRIRKVDQAGIVRAVAGTGVSGFSGDGGPALQARFNWPYDVAFSPDGTMYIVDNVNHRIRRIGTDGIITTIAGGGSGGDGPALQARLFAPQDVAVGPDGSIFLSEGNIPWVRRIGTDGILRRYAGTGNWGQFSGDGGPALSAGIPLPTDIDVASDGALYIIDSTGRTRRVGTDGLINSVAGNGQGGGFLGFSGDGGPALQATFATPTGILVDNDGNLLVGDFFNHRVRRVGAVLPGFTAADILVPSSDGAELYRFNQAGKHLSTTDAFTGHTLFTFEYDGHGYLTRIVDRDGDATSIDRVGATPIAIITADGQRTELGVDVAGYLATVRNPAGEEYVLSSTTDGLLRALARPRGYTSQFSYDSAGRLLRDEDAAGGMSTLTRTDQSQGYTVSVTSIEGRTATYKIENLSTGDQLRTNTQADGAKLVKLTKVNGEENTTAPDGTLVTSVLGGDPRFGLQSPVLSTVTVKLPSGLIRSTTKTRTATLSNAQDPLSLATHTETSSTNGRAYSRLFSRATSTWSLKSPLNRQSTLTLDSEGRPSSSTLATLATLAPTHYSYTPEGLLDSLTVGDGAAARATDLAYYDDGPSKGLLKSVVDPEGRAIEYGYDLAGRVTLQTLPGGREVRYTYDANGNVTSITPPGKDAHVLAYTTLDLQEEYAPPIAADTGTRITRYVYSLDKDLKQVLRPDARAITFDYLAPGKKLSSITTVQGTYSFGYKATTGQLETISGPGSQTISYLYDGALQMSETLGGVVAGTVSWGYDNNFWVNQESVNGLSIARGYDNDGLLVSVGSETVTRNPASGLIAGTSLGNVTSSHAYTGFGEPDSDAVSYSGQTMYQANYGVRDKLGRIVSKTETIQGESHIYAYTYDAVGRLDTVTRDGVLTDDYGYDANGSRTSNNATHATYDGQDRLLAYGNTTYTYGPNGELQSRTRAGATTSYQYDDFGNLRSAELPDGRLLEFVIDGRNRRVGRKIDGTLVQAFLYGNQLKPIAEIDPAGTVVSRFVYGTRAQVPDYMVRDGHTYRFVSDHVGSVRMLVDVADGSVTQRLDYDEFGNVLSDTNPGFQPFGFAGGIYDQDTKLIRFGARDYDPETGRWTVKDLILFAGGINLYAYVDGDPVNSIDPTGEFAIPGALVGAGIDLLLQLAQNGGNLSCIDWGSVGTSAALGALGGWVGSLGKGAEFSHWIPSRYFQPRGPLPRWMDGQWNGSNVSNWRHYKHDPSRYSNNKGEWREWGDKWNPILQQLDRIPDWMKGAGAGGALGSAIGDSESCRCQ